MLRARSDAGPKHIIQSSFQYRRRIQVVDTRLADSQNNLETKEDFEKKDKINLLTGQKSHLQRLCHQGRATDEAEDGDKTSILQSCFFDLES